ncbi:hypothetical protein [Actinokineospora sp. NBRC 105648]|uniref:hypothetical protein n=1 Tax=Actinokineospora sp. NBRC 105648 TaxID=3032206 RepID=UPI0024A138ED|nr:hypothetical protein [Actinokineospora sp. NBRC 105648]GLZ37803.1 hypothetical protein Acsp05_14280 [Actinokineospora sp. NBRC 105648]
MRFGRSKVTKHKCCDGSVRHVYRDVNDAYSMTLGDFDKKTRARLDVMEQATGEFERSHSAQMREAFFRITQANDTIAMNFRAVYMVYMSDPCGKSDYLAEQTTYLLQEHSRTNNLLIRLQALIEIARLGPKPGRDAMAQIFEALAQLPGFAERAAQAEIEQTRAASHAWLKTSRPPGSVPGLPDSGKGQHQ